MTPLAITAVGAATPLGETVAEACAAARAGLMAFREHPYPALPPEEPDDDPRPVLAAWVEGLDPALDGPARLLELAGRAHADLLRDAELEARDLRDAALLVSLPPQDAVVAPWLLAADLVPRLASRTGLGTEHLRVVEAGPAGMLALLAQAEELLASRAVKRCVLLGVDSWLPTERLRALDEAWRLKSPRNVDGLIPGEAATAVLLELPAHAAATGAPVDAEITAVRTGSEPEGFGSEKQSTAVGLTAALRGALAAGPVRGAVYCDLNGESYRGIEWGLAAARLGEALGSVRRLVHPASGWGDVGAATGGGLLALAAMAFRRGYAPGDEALVFAGTDGALRAAVRLRRG